MNYISLEVYNSLIDAKNSGKYANHICNVACALGKTKRFKVKDTDLTVTLKNTQKGGMFTGVNCFVLVDDAPQTPTVL